MLARVSSGASAFAAMDGDARVMSVAGYSSAWCTTGESPRSRNSWAATAERLPPALSPQSASLRVSARSSAPWSATHAMASVTSKAAVGPRCSGASR